MKTALYILTLSICIGACQTVQEPLKEEKSIHFKNIVLIVGDDHSANVLGAYGNKKVRTPNLDKMAAQGVQFNRAYANSPMCSASRQSFITGLYPHATGVTLLTTSFPEQNITIAERLKERAYSTAIIGKNHFNNQLSHGFDTKIERRDYFNYLKNTDIARVPDSIATRPEWKPFRDPARIWLNAEMLAGNQYDQFDIGTWYAEQAQNYLEKHQDSSFFLCVGFHEPHSPFNFPVEYRNRYQAEDMELPLTSEEDDRWIPEIFKELTEEERKGIIASYYTSVEYLDKNVGLILNKVEELGIGDSTLVVYIGDHGYLLNDHKRFEKHMMWEPAVRAPLIIQGGKQLKAGTKIEALTEFVDLAPTMLQAIGMDIPQELQGKSLLPLLNGEKKYHKKFIFSEFLADNKAMVRGERFKYIFTTGKKDLAQGYQTGLPAPGITHRLYDLEKDPYETTNLYYKPNYQQEAKRLQNEMIMWFESTHPKADSISKEWDLERRLVAFCEPTDKNAKVSAF